MSNFVYLNNFIIFIISSGCAFVQFTTRGAAEKAADATFNNLVICGSKVTIR